MKIRIFVETEYVFDATKYIASMKADGVDIDDPKKVYEWLIDHHEDELITSETYDDERNSRPPQFDD